jgi:hypothetical protein
MAEQLAKSSMCPETWRIKAGEPEHVKEQKIADLCIIGHSLAELDFRLTVNTLPQCYVVHGRPGFMAQLQVALAARHGCRIVPLDEESDDKAAHVHVLGKDSKWHKVSVTMAEATKAGWDKKNPNYRTMGDRMLMARAVTKAISLHCPEAKFALPPMDYEDAEPWGEPDGGIVRDDDQPVVVGTIFSASAAKSNLITAFEEHGFEEDTAIALAKSLWNEYNLDSDPIDAKTMSQLLQDAANEPPFLNDTVDAEVVDEETGEIVDGEPFEED